MLASAQIRLDDGDHVVQIYEEDDDLVDVVVGYLAAALTDGDAVVVIATQSHRAAFDAALAAAGVGASEIDAGGRLVVLDAEETLSRFMRAGAPEPALFDAVVGETVRGLAATGRSVRAYGEMVAVLGGAGNLEAALELERLWNGLGASIPFSLFCAYPSRLVGDADALAQVCGLHSRVVAGPPQVDADEVRHFERSPHAPRLTRHFVSETLREWGFHDLVDDACVVVSELATNAVVHAGSDVVASVTRTSRGVRIAVADRSAVPPSVRSFDLDALGGRGLVLIDRIAARWGHAITGDGKVVWADLAVPAPSAR